MSVIVAAEHLEITPAIRESVDQALARIEPLFRFEANVRVFIRFEKNRLFHVIFKTHARGQDVIGQDTGYDLGIAINHACEQLRRTLIEMKNKRSHQRRRQHEAV